MLTKYEQIAAQVETQEGVVEGGEAAGDVIPAGDANYETDFQKIERNVAVSSLTPSKSLPGASQASITFSIEVEGGNSLTADPIFDRLLRACGYRSYGDNNVARHPVNGTERGKVVYFQPQAVWTTGSQLNHGTTITANASGATFRVVGTYTPGDTKVFAVKLDETASPGTDTTITATGIDIPLVASTGETESNRAYHPIDKPTYYLKGTPAGTIAVGDVVEGGTSGAKGLVTEIEGVFGTDGILVVERSPAFGYFSTGETVFETSGVNEITAIQAPVQYDIPSLSLTFYEDGNRVRFKGCRGNGVFNFQPARPGRIDFTFQGAWDVAETEPGFAPATNIDDDVVTRYVSATATFDGSFTPLFAELSVDGGRQIALSLDPTQSEGVRVAALTDRAMTGSINPEGVQTDIFDLHDKAKTGASVVLVSEYGTGGAGKGIHFRAPAMQFQNLGRADRDGIRTYELPIGFFGKAPARGDEFTLFTF